MIVGIIDYGSGNIRSVYKSFEKAAKLTSLNINVKTINSASQLNNVDKIVLPGQGAFADCIDGLKLKKDMIKLLKNKVINEKKEFLGICVGMQLLACESEEHGSTEGLSWIQGKVKKIVRKDKNLKIPHMGWNSVIYKKNHPLFNNIIKEEDFYFVHSYEFIAEKEENVIASAQYGNELVAAIVKDNIIGTQFHPEKSQRAGIQFIKNFLEWKS